MTAQYDCSDRSEVGTQMDDYKSHLLRDYLINVVCSQQQCSGRRKSVSRWNSAKDK